MSQEPVKLVIILEGGMVQSIHSLGVPIKAVVIDYDTDGADPDDDKIEEVPQGNMTGVTTGYVDAFVHVEADNGQSVDPVIKDWANKFMEEP